MKVNELMIGDLVMAATFDEETEEDVFHPARINAISSIKELFGYKYDIEWLDDCGSESCGDLEPIHLTKEILNANGFLDNGEFPTKDHIKINYKDGWFISFCECYGLEIKYVHELQHLLRLCGLTELADNFKLE